MFYISHDSACSCAPCAAKELERCESYILDNKRIDAKIARHLGEEFRRLVSIDPELTFTERLMELDAFSASTPSQQRELVHRFAVVAREGQLEMFMAAGDELDELDELIAATEPHGVSLASVLQAARSA